MSSPLPLRPAVDHTARDRSVLDLADESTDRVFDALGSETARSVLASISDEPATASDIADCVDTSLQNVQYHLSNLEEANLVSEVGTWYSSRGTEMTVYAPAMDRLEFRLSDPNSQEKGGFNAGVSGSSTATVLND